MNTYKHPICLLTRVTILVAYIVANLDRKIQCQNMVYMHFFIIIYENLYAKILVSIRL